MFKTKNTGRAMGISAIIICVCFAMLLGTTFAWFTDTASTKVNTIKTGNFEIDILNADGSQSLADGQGDDVIKFVNKDGVVASNFLWEPGMTIRSEVFQIANKGDYALKFQFDDVFTNATTASTISGDQRASVDLTDVISYEIKDANNAVVMDSETKSSATIKLAAGEAKSFYIEFVMDGEDANNDYQSRELTFDSAAISVSAAQDTVENDYYDNTYDEGVADWDQPATTTNPADTGI